MDKHKLQVLRKAIGLTSCKTDLLKILLNGLMNKFTTETDGHRQEDTIASTEQNVQALRNLKLDMHLGNLQRWLHESESKAIHLFRKKQLSELLSPWDSCKKYDFEHKLGCGAFGEIWKAKDQNGDDCAMKKMAKPSDLQSVLAEISVLQVCIHPNIPKYLESFWLVDDFCIAMQYIEGLDMDKLKQHSDSDFNPSEIAAICHGVLSALEYLHTRNRNSP